MVVASSCFVLPQATRATRPKAATAAIAIEKNLAIRKRDRERGERKRADRNEIVPRAYHVTKGKTEHETPRGRQPFSLSVGGRG